MRSKTKLFERFRIFYKRVLLAFFFAFMLGFGNSAKAYNVGDFGYIGTGAWSVAANWYTWDGSSWIFQGTIPTSANDVYILTGDSVIVDAGGKDCKSLFVEGGAKLLADPAQPTNFYINVYGKQILNNGIIGSATAGLFNGISFQFEADTTVISSDSINPVNPANTPLFTCSRMRKDASGPTTPTNLFISMDIYSTFPSNSQVQIYNARTGSLFNITINQNATLNIGYLGNIRINGLSDASGGTAGGTLTVKGRLNVAGTLIMHTVSTNTSFPSNIVIDSTGIVNTQIIDCQASSAGKASLTIRAGGRLELYGTGIAWNVGLTFFGGINNTYNFDYNSTVVFMANGAQSFRSPQAAGVNYSNLILNSLSPGLKTISATPLTVTKDFTIQNQAYISPGVAVINIGGNFTSTSSGIIHGTSTVNFTGLDGTLQTISMGTGDTLYNFTINNVNGAKANSTLIIKRQIALTNGAFDLNAKSLTIDTPLTTGITRTNGYIISENVLNQSKVRWKLKGVAAGTYIYPFGTVGGTYIPVSFQLTAGTTDTVTVSTYPTAADNTPWPTQPVAVTNLMSSTGLVPDNRDATVKRFWQIDTVGTPTANVILNFTGAEVPPMPGVAYKAQRWYSTSWRAPFPSQTNTASSVTIPGMNAFGAIAIASDVSALPIALLRFSATSKEFIVLTNWSTASEDENDFFNVERMDGKGDIVSLGKVDGAGNSSIILHYAFTDEHPLKGISYYRLRQTDYNGKSTVSKWVAVNRHDLDEASLFPNPASGNEIRLLNSLDEENEVSYCIADMQGNEVRKGKMHLNDAVSIEGLSQGMYVFSYYTADIEPVRIRFIRQ